MHYHSVEEGESLSYTPHHLGMMQQSSRQWTQEHPSFCSQLVTGVNFLPLFPFHHLRSQTRQSSEQGLLHFHKHQQARTVRTPQPPHANLFENG